jgi:hypothetical protein
MATKSQVKSGRQAVSDRIEQNRQRLISAKGQTTLAFNELNAIPTDFADVITTIDGYAPTGEFEALSQDEKAALTSEFLALKAKAQTAQTALAAIDFTT